jgi:hypothetical protein
MAAALFRSAAFVLALLVGGPPGPTPPPPAGLIVGRTVDGVTGAVISGAIVSISRSLPPPGTIRTEELTPQELTPTRVISDSNGRFMFHGLPAGGYSVQVTKPGYAPGMFGRRSATDLGSQSLVLRDGEKRGDVSVSLWKLAAIGGTVVDETGEPVVGLQVRVLRRQVSGGALRFAQAGNQPSTDDRGVYRVSDLTPGDYIVAIVTTQTTVPDALQDQYAAMTKTGSTQEFQRELDRSRGALSGGLVMMASGQRLGSLTLTTPIGIGNSGDIAAPPIAGGKVFVYPTVYHPSATTPAAATIVRLGPGDERVTIDFQIKPIVTSAVSGVLMGPGGPEALTALDLIPAGLDSLQRDSDFATAATTTDAKGAFVFLGVPPGAYTIRSLKVPPRPATSTMMTTTIQTGSSTISSSIGGAPRPPISDEPTYWASLPVTVGDKDVTDLAMTFRTGARLSGRLEFEGAAVKPTTERMGQAIIIVSNADGRTTSSQFTLTNGVIDATSSFKTYQLPPGRYVLRGPAFLGWTFKGAFVNGRDISDTPLELNAEDIGNIVLTYTDRATDLIGTARDSNGPDGAATILVFPSQQGLWTNHGPAPRRFRSVRPGPDGVFRVVNIPAGDYVVLGVHGTVPTDWQDPAVLKQLMALGSSVSVADGENKTVNVTTREIK